MTVGQRKGVMQRGAIFDATGYYRYCLWRRWRPEVDQGTGDRVTFIMLNPSTADAQQDDPTIRRCIGFAQGWGYGCLEVVNLFAYCTSQPTHLLHVADPIGNNTDRHLLDAVCRSHRVIVAWGNRGIWHDRAQQVLALLPSYIPLHCLGTTKTQQPRHPLYIKACTLPSLYR